MRTGHFLEVLQDIKLSGPRLQECRTNQKIMLHTGELEGFAWQLRMPDAGGPLAAINLCGVLPKPVALWAILMMEINWDYHLKGCRFLWKEITDGFEKAIDALQQATQELAQMNRAKREKAAAASQQALPPPLPTDYPPLKTSDAWADEPMVIWLTPLWVEGAGGGQPTPQPSRSVRPRRHSSSSTQGPEPEPGPVSGSGWSGWSSADDWQSWQRWTGTDAAWDSDRQGWRPSRPAR